MSSNLETDFSTLVIELLRNELLNHLPTSHPTVVSPANFDLQPLETPSPVVSQRAIFDIIRDYNTIMGSYNRNMEVLIGLVQSSMTSPNISQNAPVENTRRTFTAMDTSGNISQYDPLGNISQYDPSGNISQYDPSGNISQYDPSGNTYQYDPSANTYQYDPCGNTYQYDHSANTYQYDPCGNTYQYDPCGNTYQYDPCGNIRPYRNPNSNPNIPRLRRTDSQTSQSFTGLSNLTRLWGRPRDSGIHDYLFFLPTSNDGLTQTEIQNATTLFVYSDTTPHVYTQCPISFDEFVNGETIIRINHCGHIFRPTELRQWLSRHTGCPVCRYNIQTNSPATYDNDNDETDYSDIPDLVED